MHRFLKFSGTLVYLEFTHLLRRWDILEYSVIIFAQIDWNVNGNDNCCVNFCKWVCILKCTCLEFV